MAKKTYAALTTIDHNLQRFVAGESIELDDKTEAPQLLAVNAIELAPGEPAAKKAQ